jgi:hypothetical protein
MAAVDERVCRAVRRVFRRTSTVVVALAVTAAVGVAACGTEDSEAPAGGVVTSVVRAPDLRPGTIPDAPQGKPLVTVTGRITTTNVDGALRLDEAELARMGLLEMSVDDPWVKRRLALQGVWLRDLVELARPDAGATTLHIRALDDYQVDLDLSDVRTDAILLATRNAQGAALAVEDGGPSRVVFADGLTERYSPELWIWSVDTIEVR